MEKQYKKERKWLTKSIFWIAIVILILLTIFTTALLALRLVDFVMLDERELQLQHNMDYELNLFRVQYKNASGEITVSGADGQKVVAPGTSVEYTLRLRNNDDTALDYEIVPKFTQTEGYSIPIMVRMIGPDGNYVIGSNIDWVPIDQLPKSADADTLEVEESVEYVFQWKWEFESGNDEYDTFLGTSAVDKDIMVKADFRVYAATSTQIVTGSGLFNTNFGKVMLMVLFLLLLILAIILLLYARERAKAAERREQRRLEENEVFEEQDQFMEESQDIQDPEN